MQNADFQEEIAEIDDSEVAEFSAHDDFPAHPANGCAFYEDGQQVGVTLPDVYDPEPETQDNGNGGLDVEQMLDLLSLGAVDARVIGERVLVLQYMMPGCSRRPKNLRELGQRLGMSPEAARKRVDKLKAEFANEIANSDSARLTGNA